VKIYVDRNDGKGVVELEFQVGDEVWIVYGDGKPWRDVLSKIDFHKYGIRYIFQMWPANVLWDDFFHTKSEAEAEIKRRNEES